MHPFTTPGPVKALAYLTGQTHLRCTAPGIPGITPGDVLPLTVHHEDTHWPESRISHDGHLHLLAMQGRELLIRLTAMDGSLHVFHTRQEDAARTRLQTRQPAVNAFRPRAITGHATHHHLAALVDNFHIPAPPGVIDQDPAQYQRHLARLAQLEAFINA